MKTMYWVLHFFALFIFFPALFVTIPMHMNYNANQERSLKQEQALKDLEAARLRIEEQFNKSLDKKTGKVDD